MSRTGNSCTEPFVPMLNYCYFVCSDFVSQIWTLVFLSIVEAFVYLANLGINSQIQHPRQRIDHFDLIVTPLHDYYALSPMGRQEVPRLLLPWLSPRQPPDKHVVLNISQVCPVCCMKLFVLTFETLRSAHLDPLFVLLIIYLSQI